MKKIITFIPLGIGISGAFLYLFNLISFRVINNGMALITILSRIKAYLYIAILGFVAYFLIKLLENIKLKKDKVNYYEEPVIENEPVIEAKQIVNTNSVIEEVKEEPKVIIKEIVKPHQYDSYCKKCGEPIDGTDKYCKNCGCYQLSVKSDKLLLKRIIDVIEIIILLLVIYFSLFMLFDYKESKDKNFTSPFKFSLTK